MRWLAGVIAEEKEEVDWVTSGWQVTKDSLNFIEKACWIIVHHRLAPMMNDNTLRVDKTALVACIMSRYTINILMSW